MPWSHQYRQIILVNFQGSIEEANERLIFYCMYDNTQDKIKTDEAKAMKRKHPLDYIKNDCIDYNSMFDQQLGVYDASTPNIECADVSENDWI